MSGGVSYSYLADSLPYGFCPGCSHGQISDALGAALARLAPDARQAVLVSDIGCVGLIDKHFNINTFHGLHGRSITYATGLKLARPGLTVFVVIGDGGCGIGGHHLIQAARRGLDMTVIVFNNFNYGMTGGEHSSTTPLGALTSSTPGGNDEQPLDLCGLAMAAGATFVARAAAFDKDLAGLIERAARHRGFALLDIWELCTAYFMPNNDFKKKQLLELAVQTNMPFGILREEAPRRRDHAGGATSVKPARRVALEPAFQATLARPLSMLVAGSAGQKIKSAATMLARAAIRAGLYATQKDDYPITVKTGHSISELILSPRPIRFTGVDRPDIAIVLTEDGLRRTRAKLEAMAADGTIFADDRLALPAGLRAKACRIDAGAASKDVGRENVALWALAHVLRQTQSVPFAALADTAEKLSPPTLRPSIVAAVARASTPAQLAQ